MAKDTNYIEVDGKIVEIEDMELFNRVGSLAAYNEALGNKVGTNFWGKLFAWNQAVAKPQKETEQREYRLSAQEPDHSEPAEQYDEVKEVWGKCRDVDGTPILGWWQ
jgi:hypothetical protein